MGEDGRGRVGRGRASNKSIEQHGIHCQMCECRNLPNLLVLRGVDLTGLCKA